MLLSYPAFPDIAKFLEDLSIFKSITWHRYNQLNISTKLGSSAFVSLPIKYIMPWAFPIFPYYHSTNSGLLNFNFPPWRHGLLYCNSYQCDLVDALLPIPMILLMNRNFILTFLSPFFLIYFMLYIYYTLLWSRYILKITFSLPTLIMYITLQGIT